jgi:hypothetical protein
MDHKMWTWVTAILASITVLMDAGTVAHLFDAHVLILVGSIATAVAAFISAINPGTEEAQKTQQLPPAPQAPGPQKR